MRHIVGRGARVMLGRAFGRTGAAADDAMLDACMPDFLSHYRANIAVESRPFPGSLEALEAFRAAGRRMAVCTNKPTDLAVALLDALDMSRFFEAVLGADSLPVRKPDPAPLIEAVARAGGERSRAIMIGDSEVDAETARNAGVPCVIFTFGYTALDCRDFGADALLESYDALPAAIERIEAADGRSNGARASQ